MEKAESGKKLRKIDCSNSLYTNIIWFSIKSSDTNSGSCKGIVFFRGGHHLCTVKDSLTLTPSATAQLQYSNNESSAPTAFTFKSTTTFKMLKFIERALRSMWMRRNLRNKLIKCTR